MTPNILAGKLIMGSSPQLSNIYGSLISEIMLLAREHQLSGLP